MTVTSSVNSSGMALRGIDFIRMMLFSDGPC